MERVAGISGGSGADVQNARRGGGGRVDEGFRFRCTIVVESRRNDEAGLFCVVPLFVYFQRFESDRLIDSCNYKSVDGIDHHPFNFEGKNSSPRLSTLPFCLHRATNLQISFKDVSELLRDIGSPVLISPASV